VLGGDRMSQYLIVHPSTGTIIVANDCLILDMEVLSTESFDHDDDIISIARKHGSPVIPI
jgi:hypothetical protein